MAIVGAGAAGLSLAYRLTAVRTPSGGRVRVLLLEPPEGPERPPARTWCFWEPESGEWDTALGARWRRLSLIGADGAHHDSAIAPLVYKMLRSTDHADFVRSRLEGEVEQVTATVTEIEDGVDRAVVRARDPAGGQCAFTAHWVYDSRPPGAVPGAPEAATVLQHFRGWFLRTAADAFDPSTPTLMDFRTPQPRSGVSFGYVLPFDARAALVEYTEFTREVLDDAGYEAALGHYTRDVLGIEGVEITGVEQGVIPMTDARFPTRVGRRVFRIGAGGGATRPATGYTFAGIQRQTAAVARALAAGSAVPVPPIPHRQRHLAMDGVLLRALTAGRIEGADFFTRLFQRNATRQVLRFLDGTSSLATEVRIGVTTPVAAMAATTAERAWWALRGRRAAPVAPPRT
ncbi:lycopene cyclase family protein [Salinactinospora qingdaonensis]|uniref:Lycopene cyclase family protein n=1 Tax=Salinactinospora qingdaonensis TaxID=702744 RepID=A0ABP7GH36_9ACTN